MISGDDAVVEEAQRVVGEWKELRQMGSWFSLSPHLMPEAAYQVIRNHVRAALSRVEDFEPYILGPIKLEISFKNYLPAEVMAYLPILIGWTLIHPFLGNDMTGVSKFIALLRVTL
ncbi:MAG: hypothetical protein CM1200mP14_26510 [Gammaproteobacteria bacterium]|nr:MAG: hypothetical protein CM1200mP14_26510 [Gammaproteobacteria bacterium]